jgi:hypothetical protein
LSYLDNRIYPRKPDPRPPTVRKVPVNTVPYGDSIARNGKTMWAAFDGDRLVAVGATAGEARSKYREALARPTHTRKDAGLCG